MSSYNRAQMNVSQELLEKRRTFIRSCVKLLAVYSSRHKTSIHSKETELNYVLTAQLNHLRSTVRDAAELQILLSEFLGVLNVDHLTKICENCFTLWLKNTSGDEAIIGAMLKSLCETCTNCDLVAALLEVCISTYFLNRGSNFTEPSWGEIASLLVPYPPRLTELERVVVSRGYVLTLHVLLQQKSSGSADPIALMNIALQWLEMIKIRLFG